MHFLCSLYSLDSIQIITCFHIIYVFNSYNFFKNNLQQINIIFDTKTWKTKHWLHLMWLLLLLLYLWKFNYRLEVGNLYNLTMVLKIWRDDARVDYVTKGESLDDFLNQWKSWYCWWYCVCVLDSVGSLDYWELEWNFGFFFFFYCHVQFNFKNLVRRVV